MEHVLVEEQAEMVEELKPRIAEITKNIHGNHVIQKVIEMFPRRIMPNIMGAFRGQFSNQLAAHVYGCRVVQRMLERSTPEEKQELMRDLYAHANHLITDQFGNYVAQHIIEEGATEDRNRFIALVGNKFITYSKHKFASNVVEKCIEFGTREQRRMMQAQLTVPDGQRMISPLQLLIKDQFGNYVIREYFHSTRVHAGLR